MTRASWFFETSLSKERPLFATKERGEERASARQDTHTRMLTHTVDLLLEHRAPVQLGAGVAQFLATVHELGIMYATCACERERVSTAQQFFTHGLSHHSPFANSQFV